jgi:hypothetical protein
VSSPAPSGSSTRTAAILLGLAGTFAAWAALLAWTGGVDLRPLGIPFRTTEWFRPAGAAFVLVSIWIIRFPGAARRLVDALVALTDRAAPLLVVGLAVGTLIIGLRFGSYVAGGADSYGYVSEAKLWRAGELVVQQPFTRDLPWPEQDETFSPLGYRPWRSGGAIVPRYAPGLPILMALAALILGDCGMYVITPVLGAVTIWLTYVLGVQTGSRIVGLGAAALLASSPVFVFMLLSPMSDVPVMPFFAAALIIASSKVRARAFWTGLALSGAIMIRPNLAPVAGVFVVFLAVREATWRQRFAAVVACGLGVLPSLVAIGIINAHLYGAPWTSGYGDLRELFAWRFLVDNLSRYPKWLVDTHTPLIGLCVVPLIAVRRVEAGSQAAVLLCGAFVLALWGSYLFYLPFDAWWYLRFVLASFPPILVLALLGWRLIVSFLPSWGRAVVLAGLFAGVATFQVRQIQDMYLLNFRIGESVYPSAASYVDKVLPRNAVIVTGQHSGSIRFYAGRLTMRFDVLDPAWWPRALDVLVAKGYRPYVLLTEPEEEPFRQQFSLSARDDAPGTIVAEMTQPQRIRLYDPLRQTSPTKPEAIPRVLVCPCYW